MAFPLISTSAFINLFSERMERISSRSRSRIPTWFILTPPKAVFLMVISGRGLLMRIPASYSSFIRTSTWCALKTSTRITIMSAPLTTPITSLPRPFPIAAPAMRPGISRIWILAPLCSRAPGTTVRVVNAYAATSLFVPVRVFRSVLFPVEGKPTRTTVASPDFLTE
ncbi:MAG: hypothetical protein A4E40_01515 [Methanoregulaceae archaeon PtaU1.Bin059]|nr:MAG: hypothetical protein A4E40_01515 [Methanoregulaceae archaeon PtaU1.Bin059]